MKKNVFGRKFKRDKNERTALFKGLMSSLIVKERIQTTEQKAKAIKAGVDKLVTRAKKNTLRPEEVYGADAFKKLKEDIASRFSQRNGGYTRIIRLGKRFGDDASMVVMEWVEQAKAVTVTTPKKDAKKEVKKTAVKPKEALVKKPVRRTKKNA